MPPGHSKRWGNCPRRKTSISDFYPEGVAYRSPGSRPKGAHPGGKSRQPHDTPTGLHQAENARLTIPPEPGLHQPASQETYPTPAAPLAVLRATVSPLAPAYPTPCSEL